MLGAQSFCCAYPFLSPGTAHSPPLGQKPFRRSLRGSDALSETSSVSHIEDLEKMEHLSGGLEQNALEADSPERPPGASPTQETEQMGAPQKQAQRTDDGHTQIEELDSLR